MYKERREVQNDKCVYIYINSLNNNFEIGPNIPVHTQCDYPDRLNPWDSKVVLNKTIYLCMTRKNENK